MRHRFAAGMAALFVSCAAAGAAGRAQTPDDAAIYAKADIAYGARLYAAQCQTCHGPQGDAVAGVAFRSGTFRHGSTDGDLVRIITNGIPGTGMLGFRFDPPETTAIVAYLRNMNTFDASAAKPGDPSRGRTIFEGRGECTRCHRVGGAGARTAPDLSDVGALRGAGSIERSLVDPSSQMMPINRPVRIVTRDGRTITGRRLNEDTYTVQLIDDHERLVSLNKSDLREYSILRASPMPSYKDKLTADELADLVAYLISLKGR